MNTLPKNQIAANMPVGVDFQMDLTAPYSLTPPVLLSVDSYKGEHYKYLNSDVDFTQGYIEARKGDKVQQVAGITRLAKQLAVGITTDDILYFSMFAAKHSFGHAAMHSEGWSRIVDEMDGNLPLEIHALPEGTVVKPGLPILVVRNTVAGFGWLVNYFIDMILKVWKDMSVAGKAFRMKRILKRMGSNTISDADRFDFWLTVCLHDFGVRSIGTSEEAAISGVAANQNISGSDNWPATWLNMKLYDLTMDQMPTGSVVALEHNVILSVGEEGEHELLLNFAKDILTSGRVGSVLIDTYDIDAVLEMFAKNKELLLQWLAEGDYQGKLVFRPDSGHEIETPIMVCEFLMRTFGSVTNDKGFRELDGWLGVIQGDGVNEDMLEMFENRLYETELSALNFVFGCGGELISNHTRDDYSWCGKVTVNTLNDGTEVPCGKSPKYGAGKKTKQGYFRVYETDGGWGYDQVDSFDLMEGFYCYFYNGVALKPQTWDEVKERAYSYL
ncbi:nicotinamide phosphoribosyltransferase [Vibrio phage BONAISHI]|nr:nicotinamide phosphoribosyltransferase [Vibrio phage BONAISHI]